MKKLHLLSLLIITGITAFAQVPPVLLWQTALGGTNEDHAKAIVQSPDGTYGVAGYVSSTDGDVVGYHGGSSDWWVVKLDASGNPLWEKALGGSNDEEANSIVANADGGYTVAGYSESIDGDVTGNFDTTGSHWDFWVVRLSNTGSIIWEKSYGGSYSEIAYSITHTSDGGYALTGYNSSSDGDVTGNHGDGDVWVIKINSTGDLQWEQSYGGTGFEEGNSIVQTFDGGFIVAGYTNSSDNDVTSNHGGADYWVLKLSSSGGLQWQKTFGGSAYDEAASIIQTADSGYAVAGYTESTDGDVTGLHGIWEDYWVVKLNSTGTMQWEKTYGGTATDEAYSILQTADGGYAVAGFAQSQDGDVVGNLSQESNDWLIKTSSNGTLQWQLPFGVGTLEGEAAAYAMIATSDSSIAVAGYADNNSGQVTGVHDNSDDYWIAKLGYYPTGIRQVPVATALSVYPDPASDQLFIEAQNEPITGIQVFDMVGREIMNTVYSTGTSPNQKMQLNVSGLTAGAYMVKVETANGFTTKPWIKQ